MNLISQNSLSVTLDNFNEAYYSGRSMPVAEKKKLALWLASRQGAERSYAGMVSPTMFDYKRGVILFTGEKIDMNASIGHIMGEEALRALHLLGLRDKQVLSAINNSRKGLKKAVERSLSRGYDVTGTYCCGKCSVAYWRNLSAEGVAKNRRILNAGLKVLKRYRDGKGKWKRFPFYYTVLSLTGIDLPAAKEELKYAAEPLARIANRPATDKYAERRKMVVELALGMI